MVSLFPLLELRVQMSILMEGGIILKSVGRHSVYKIHLNITRYKLTDTEKISETRTLRRLAMLFALEAGGKSDFMYIAQYLHIECCPIHVSQVTGSRFLKRCKCK